MNRFRLIVALCVTVAGGFSQEAPTYFKLFLPSLFDAPFERSGTVIEVPGRVSRISVLVVDAESRRMDPGSYRILINGKGSGNVFDTRGTQEGSLLEMNEATLSRRPDELFDPDENTIEVLAKDRRGRQYYQSWILRNARRTGPSLFLSSTSVSPDDPGGVPPDLILAEPVVPPVVKSSDKSISVTVKGTLAASSPGATLRVNGQPAGGPAPSATWQFAHTTAVSASTRELVLEAVDRKRNARRVIIPIVSEKKTPAVFRFPGQKYGLVIGVSRYGDGPDVPPLLEGAAADAREFADALQARAGFPPENVRLLLDEKATADQVRIAFSDFVAKARGPDLLVVYVAARGLHDPRLGRSQNLYLALHGTQLSNLDSTALTFFDIELLVNRSVRCNQTFLIFDVGHPLAGQWQFPGRNLVNNHLLNLFSEQEGRSVLVSGSADESSVRRRSGGASGGLFTQWLTAGLAGESDLNADGRISASELFQFVSARVSQESGGQQQPRFRVAGGAKSNHAAP